ncbi:MAG: hypothetical protein ACPGXK_10545 [Phycisphaerae bacterium]
MRIRHDWGSGIILSALAGSMMLTGCDTPVVSVDTQIPATLQAIIEDSTAFDGSESALIDVDAGTVAEDPSTLDGCWGNFRTTDVGADSNEAQAFGTTSIQEVTAMVFDASAGELSVLVLLQNGGGNVALVNVLSGTFTVTEGNALTQNVTEAGITDPATGELTTSSVDQATPIMNDWLITLSEDELKVVRVGVDGEVDQDDALILSRFTCPSAG